MPLIVGPRGSMASGTADGGRAGAQLAFACDRDRRDSSGSRVQEGGRACAQGDPGGEDVVHDQDPASGDRGHGIVPNRERASDVAGSGRLPKRVLSLGSMASFETCAQG
jgi:hypothetical protein